MLLLLGLGVLVFFGFVSLFASRSPGTCSIIGAGGAVAGSALALIPVIRFLLGVPFEAIRLPWNIPFASFSIALDPLSAFFAALILGVSMLSAIFGGEYLLSYRGKKRLGPPWFFFNLLVASMVLVVLARNAILFLMAWELMAIASFFLVIFESENDKSREAGLIYLIATHLGTAFLLVFFLLLGAKAGSLDFDRFEAVTWLSPSIAGALFICAVVGFGSKAGFLPFHVWLPVAHPAAPSHVSALMSGVMIKIGIYGLIRAMTFLGRPPEWWGWLLIGIGAVSGVSGIVFALAQHDFKRLLAFSSVENIGIITFGLGLGVLGISLHAPTLVFLGFSGAFLHVINHACYKSLLFLGAGAVAHSAGTRQMDRLGGLYRSMPGVGIAVLIGAAGICGLPPLNGFVSEFLIYFGAFSGGILYKGIGFVPFIVVILSLTIFGGLAVVSFTKLFGIVFLGEPRGEDARHVHRPGPAIRWPLYILAAFCVGIGAFAPYVVRAVASIAGRLAYFGLEVAIAPREQVLGPLRQLMLASAVLAVLIVLLALLRRRLLAGREVRAAVTWDCGYVAPTPRIQYTSSSFVQPLTELFRGVLRTRKSLPSIVGYFPRAAAFVSETYDIFMTHFYEPLFAWADRRMHGAKRFQHGRIHGYIFYILITLVALLIWCLEVQS